MANPNMLKPGSPVLAGAGLYLLVFLAFLPALGGAFVWDDKGAILENPYVQSPSGLWSIWFSGRLMDYWPLTYTLFWTEWQLWGANSGAFHAVNLALHATVALVLWRVFRRLAIPGAFLIAAAFAVHPVTVASAAWIVEGKNTLSLLLGALATLCWLRFDDAEGKRWYWLSLAAFAFSLFSKTSLVTLPLVFLLIAWWRRSRIGWTDVARAAPFLTLSLALGFATILFQMDHAIHNEVLPDRDVLSRIAGIAWCVSFYWLKDIVPLNLSIIYPSWEIDARTFFAWLPFAALTGIAIGTWFRREAWGRPVLFAGAAFSILLLPVTGVIDMAFHRFSFVADHLQYVAVSVPLALVVGVAASWLRSRNLSPWLAPSLGCALVAVLAFLSFKQSAAYRNDTAFWAHTVKHNPNAWVAHYNLGKIASDAGAAGIAEQCFERALELNNGHARSHNSLGAIRATQGRVIEAAIQYHQAISLRPDFAEPHYNMGLILAQRGDLTRAIDSMQRAVSLKPDYAEAFDGLGVACTLQGDHAAAVGYFRRAILLDPQFTKAYNGLGTALAEIGSFDQSIAAFRLAVKSGPENALAHFRLGTNLNAQGQHLEAIPHLAKAVELHPANAEGRLRLAEALAGTGDRARAVAELTEALRLDPAYEAAKELLRGMGFQPMDRGVDTPTTTPLAP